MRKIIEITARLKTISTEIGGLERNFDGGHLMAAQILIESAIDNLNALRQLNRLNKS